MPWFSTTSSQWDSNLDYKVADIKPCTNSIYCLNDTFYLFYNESRASWLFYTNQKCRLEENALLSIPTGNVRSLNNSIFNIFQLFGRQNGLPAVRIWMRFIAACFSIKCPKFGNGALVNIFVGGYLCLLGYLFIWRLWYACAKSFE